MAKPKNPKDGVLLEDFDGPIRPFSGLKPPINPSLHTYWVIYDILYSSDTEKYQSPDEYIEKLESALESLGSDFMYKGGYRGKDIDYEKYKVDASVPVLEYSIGKRKNALSKRTNGFYEMLEEEGDFDKEIIEMTENALDTFWTAAVSASHQLVLDKFAERHGLDEAIGLENKTDKDGRYIDEVKMDILSPKGKEAAVEFLKEEYPDLNWEFSIAIGDSPTHDKPLFDSVKTPILYCGKDKKAKELKEKANENGWEFAKNAEEVNKIVEREKSVIEKFKENEGDYLFFEGNKPKGTEPESVKG